MVLFKWIFEIRHRNMNNKKKLFILKLLKYLLLSKKTKSNLMTWHFILDLENFSIVIPKIYKFVLPFIKVCVNNESENQIPKCVYKTKKFHFLVQTLNYF